MAKYVLMYAGGSMPESEEEVAVVMAAWGAWYTALGTAVVDEGNPFTPSSKTITSDGVVSDTSPEYLASGYSIINAESLDAAVELAKGCPILSAGGLISVFETLEIG